MLVILHFYVLLRLSLCDISGANVNMNGHSKLKFKCDRRIEVPILQKPPCGISLLQLLHGQYYGPGTLVNGNCMHVMHRSKWSSIGSCLKVDGGQFLFFLQIYVHYFVWHFTNKINGRVGVLPSMQFETKWRDVLHATLDEHSSVC